jgi:arsenite-transporting ATPase
MRIILYTGKGGVGKTTISAATSIRAASLGYKTLVISTDIAHSLADSFSIPLSNDPTPVGPPGLYAAELDTGEELERYWGDIKRKLASILKDFGLESKIAGEMAIIPGLDEIISLVRIKKYFDEAKFDVLIIDSAPTGSAMRLLGAPDLNHLYIKNLLGFVRDMSGLFMPKLKMLTGLPLSENKLEDKLQKLFGDVEQLRKILVDPEVTSVRLVLNPDKMALLETERAFTFFSLYGLTVEALFINRIIPPEISDPYLEKWKENQKGCRQQIAEIFDPLPLFEIPLLKEEVNGVDQLKALGERLFNGTDPVKRLSDVKPLHFDLKDGKYTLTLRLIGVEGSQIDLERYGDELRIQVGKYKRTIALPQYVAGLKPSSASLEEGYLKVEFKE